MYSRFPIHRRRGLAAGAYLAASALLATAVGWGTWTVSTQVVALIENAVLDGSGRLTPTVSGPETHLPATAVAADMPAHAADEPAPILDLRPVRLEAVAAPRVSTDNPEQDPAWNYHRGSSATYKTYCVRLCDGYFWPLSFSTTGDRFDQDEATCNTTCGSPARLFVHKMPGGGPGTMVSLDGLPYTALKTAFLFRTKYVEACRCQPQPWEQQATDRHRLYAAVAAANKGDRKASATVASLRARVETQSREAATALSVANVAASKELTQLARRNRLEAPPRYASRIQSRSAPKPNLAELDEGDGFFMGLGAGSSSTFGQPPAGKSGYRPASGSNRNWRDKVFSDN